MKRLSLFMVLFCGIYAAVSALAAPNFVTPAMMKRNGLTDEQYELLWRQGKHPQIDVAAARDWVFRASRFQNVTNWLDVCGKANDFAKLSYKLQGDNIALADTNAVLVATNHVLKVELADADGYRKAVKDIEKAARKDTKNLSKLRKDIEKYAKKAETEDFKTLCTLLLEMLPEAN